MRSPKFIFINCCMVLLCCSPMKVAAATMQDSTITDSTIFQLLIKDNIHTLTLQMDFDSLFENKYLKEERAAKLSLHYSEDSLQDLSIKVRARGVYRRKFCDFPPLRLNLDKKDLRKLGLHPSFDKLKLVTHCINDSKGEQVLLKEYWAYQLYNLLSPNSFKVHLVSISYINSNQLTDTLKHIAFLIENTEELAQRLGGEIIDSFGLRNTGVEQSSYYRTTMFNYMIGNLDWKIASQRNVKLIRHPQKGILIVPYDFDMSGLVYPSYARLNSDYQQKKFKDRHCIGVFQNWEDVQATVEKFSAQQSNLFSIFQECPRLTSDSKKEIISYLNSFFWILEKEKRIKRVFRNSIRLNSE